MTIFDIKKNYTNIDWLKSNHTKLHYFGLGFIQLKLTPEFRLHFYTERLPPIVGDEDIHDHRYPFGSHILRGEFVQNIYQMIDGNKYVLEYESCQEGQSSEIIKECDFEHLNRSIYSEGSKYLLNEDTFHNVEALYAITLIERPAFHCKDRARVAHIKGAEKVCPFSKKIDEKRVVEYYRFYVGELMISLSETLEDQRLQSKAEFIKNTYKFGASKEAIKDIENWNKGYHIKLIPKGTYGEISKIEEEIIELKDAQEQGCKIMELVELSDIYGAIEGYLRKYHPGVLMNDLKDMAGITRRAFLSGERS